MKLARARSRTGHVKRPLTWTWSDLDELSLRVLFEACASNVALKTNAEAQALDALYEQTFEAMKEAGLLDI